MGYLLHLKRLVAVTAMVWFALAIALGGHAPLAHAQSTNTVNHAFPELGFSVDLPTQWAPASNATFNQLAQQTQSPHDSEVLAGYFLRENNLNAEIQVFYDDDYSGFPQDFSVLEGELFKGNPGMTFRKKSAAAILKIDDPNEGFSEVAALIYGNNRVVRLFVSVPANGPQTAKQVTNTFINGFQYDPGYRYSDVEEPGMGLELLANILGYGFYIFFGLGILLVGYVGGRFNEGRHWASIKKREKQHLHLPCVTSKLKHVTTPEQQQQVESAYMVAGSVVLSDDKFKKTLASIRSIFGGNIASYETIVDRARREALLRMKAQAIGADMIVNTRIETSCINMSRGGKNDVPTTIEVLAFGTAVSFSANAARSATPQQASTATHNTPETITLEPSSVAAPTSSPSTVSPGSSPLAAPNHTADITDTSATEDTLLGDQLPYTAPPNNTASGSIDFNNISIPTKQNSLFLD